ncbi:MAG: prepilin-type N-terminal cleavage/methylation domain-containing protein [Deltaproteobacteria bacterium]
MKTMTKLKSSGFTLVEVIITIVIAAIVGAMLVTVMGTSMTKSSDPIFRMQTSFSIQRVMENFLTVYEKYYAGDLPALRDAIAGGVPGGNEGAALDNNFGKYTIVENHFVKFDASNAEVNINSTPGDPVYGQYLKVTIKNSNNETLTYIFAG